MVGTQYSYILQTRRNVYLGLAQLPCQENEKSKPRDCKIRAHGTLDASPSSLFQLSYGALQERLDYKVHLMLTLGREDSNTTISMISRLGSFVIFEGTQTSIDKNSYIFCDFSRLVGGGGGGVWYPLSLPLDPRMKIQIFWQFIVHPYTATLFILKMLLLIMYATYIRVYFRLNFFMGINPDKMIPRRGQSDLGQYC